MPQFEGVVEDVIFRNEHNGWTVLSLKAGREHITCVGELPAFTSGERLAVEGEWAEHRDYGRQLKITACQSVRPTTMSGIERYLGSGIIKGVGPATAKLIVAHFGKDALDILDFQPDRLTEIDGIGPKRASLIVQSYQEQRETRQAMVFLQGCGLSPALATRVIRIFGDQVQRVVKDDPYILAEKVEGVGFKTADGIASSLGIEAESEHRLTCGVTFVLDEAAHISGHMYLPRAQLIERATALLGVAAELIERAIRQLTLDGRLIQRQSGDEDVIYERKLYEAEVETAERLMRLHRGCAPIDEGAARRAIDSYERESGILLGEAQRAAARLAAGGGVMILTGGPGTGKTTCINCILRLVQESGETVLCAPTGRAAKRMTEATGQNAQTIHRLLEYGADGEQFGRNEDNPLKAGAVIVDELSMVDIFLMRALLRALKGGARVILVGDADQLPSVGAGNVLRDLVQSGVLPVAQLTEVFRQAGESMIVVNAHRINRGEMPMVNRKGTDFFFERAQSAQQAAELTRALNTRRLPGYLDVDPLRGIQVMTPMKKGDAGVWALNRLLQESLNPPAPGKREAHLGEMLLREGDKVMQVRNNYDLEWRRGAEGGTGAFNGDIGFVTAIDPEEGTVEVTFDDDRVTIYGDAEQDDLEMAYCMSVHKSQGSEFEAVILVLTGGPRLLFTRNLLYTAVTRARRLVVLVGREDCVSDMVSNNYILRRYSALAERLREMPGGA